MRVQIFDIDELERDIPDLCLLQVDVRDAGGAWQTFCYFHTREEAVSVARRLAIGTPAFEGDFCAFAAKSPASISLPSTVALEAWIEIADTMLADALSRKRGH